MTEAEVYYKYKNKVYGLALIMVSNKFDAKDVTSDVFEKYIRYIKSNNTFKNEKHMARWFATVTRNTAIDYIRSRTKRFEREAEEDINDMEAIPMDVCRKTEFACDLERRLDHEEVLKKINPRYKEVLGLFLDLGFSIKEIAAILNENEGNVKTLLFRAKKKYREIAGNGGDENE